jgi:hypothetical protein
VLVKARVLNNGLLKNGARERRIETTNPPANDSATLSETRAFFRPELLVSNQAS